MNYKQIINEFIDYNDWTTKSNIDLTFNEFNTIHLNASFQATPLLQTGADEPLQNKLAKNFKQMDTSLSYIKSANRFSKDNEDLPKKATKEMKLITKPHCE